MKIVFYYLFKGPVYNRAIDIKNIRTDKQNAIESIKNFEEEIAWSLKMLNDSTLTIPGVDRLLRKIASNEDEIIALKKRFKL